MSMIFSYGSCVKRDFPIGRYSGILP